MKILILDTNVIIAKLRGTLNANNWSSYLTGRAPMVSPITLHELRRGIRPGSPWEKNIDLVPAPLCAPPSTDDWILAADLIRILFGKARRGPELARIQIDALIAITAKSLDAELWSRDEDMRPICDRLKVRLFTD